MMADTTKAMRADHDARRSVTRRMSMPELVAYYFANPRAYFIDRQFNFGSAGVRYGVTLDRAMNMAANQCDGFDTTVVTHLAICLQRLDYLNIDTCRALRAIAEGAA